MERAPDRLAEVRVLGTAAFDCSRSGRTRTRFGDQVDNGVWVWTCASATESSPSPASFAATPSDRTRPSTVGLPIPRSRPYSGDMTLRPWTAAQAGGLRSSSALVDEFRRKR